MPTQMRPHCQRNASQSHSQSQIPTPLKPPQGGAAAFGGGPPPFTPAPGSRDLKSVLYNWAWHMGMLRGQAEPELIGTLEYQAQGSIDVGGEP